VSVTVIKPELARFPILATWIPYVAEAPGVKFVGEEPFDTVRSEVGVGGIVMLRDPTPTTKYDLADCVGAMLLKTKL
jgi:hypothetical protein